MKSCRLRRKVGRASARPGNTDVTAFRLSLIFIHKNRRDAQKSWDRPSFSSGLSAGAVQPALPPIFWLVGEGTLLSVLVVQTSVCPQTSGVGLWPAVAQSVIPRHVQKIVAKPESKRTPGLWIARICHFRIAYPIAPRIHSIHDTLRS